MGTLSRPFRRAAISRCGTGRASANGASGTASGVVMPGPYPLLTALFCPPAQATTAAAASATIAAARTAVRQAPSALRRLRPTGPACHAERQHACGHRPVPAPAAVSQSRPTVRPAGCGRATPTAAAAAGSPRGPGGIRTALPPGELPKLPDPGSGHHGDRPSGRLHQPHRQRTDQPVTRMGGRPDHDGVGVDLLSHPAQLSEGITPDGDEGDGDAELPGKLLRPA